jgi:hypothetical protein
MGEGPFVEDQITSTLRLRPDPENANHGFIEPANPMAADEYVRAIQATRGLWVVDEGNAR